MRRRDGYFQLQLHTFSCMPKGATITRLIFVPAEHPAELDPVERRLLE
jgi:hypothetical protein